MGREANQGSPLLSLVSRKTQRGDGSSSSNTQTNDFVGLPYRTLEGLGRIRSGQAGQAPVQNEKRWTYILPEGLDSSLVVHSPAHVYLFSTPARLSFRSWQRLGSRWTWNIGTIQHRTFESHSELFPRTAASQPKPAPIGWPPRTCDRGAPCDMIGLAQGVSISSG